MKLPNWLKIVWWVLLAGFFAFLLYQRYDSIISGAATPMDIVIFLILIALITIPLFQEVNFFGVSLKKEFDSLKSEVKGQIINLRSDIQNTINMRTEISPQIYLTPPTDSELPAIEERIRPVFEQVLREQGLERPVSLSKELEVPDRTLFLFQVRYAIENELRRIQHNTWFPPGERRYPAFSLRAAINLSDRGIIRPEVVSIIIEIHAICNSAIHGDDVSEASFKFIEDVSPQLLTYLKSIQEQPITWNPQWKPKE